MRFFAVWVYLTWKNFTFRLFVMLGQVKVLYVKALCWIFKHTHYRILFGSAKLMRSLRLTGLRYRDRSAVATANRKTLLNDDKKLDFAWLSQRRRMFELGATYGQNPQILAQISACAKELNAVVEPLHQSGSPVILAPLHMISDILAGIVGSETYPGKATVIVSSSAEVYQERVRLDAGVNLSYCSIHDNNTLIAGNLTATIMDAAEHKRNIIIFPDITPDYTIDTNAAKTDKMKCRLFDRPANIHSGVIRIARVLSAKIVFYYLYYDDGLKIHIHSPMGSKEAARVLPEFIESSITRHPDDWLLWHSHSLYYINE